MLDHEVADDGALVAVEVHGAPGGGAALAAHRPRPRLDKPGAEASLGVEGEVLLVVDVGVVQLELAVGLAVELDPGAAGEHAVGDALVGVAGLLQGAKQVLDLGPVNIIINGNSINITGYSTCSRSP